MSQTIISYVLSKLANIADVRPEDVNTSFRDRSITLKSVSLRRDAMNAILPIPVEDCTISSMAIFLPSLATSESIRVEVEQARLVAEMGLPEPSPERTMEEILSNITNETILGWTRSDLFSEDVKKELSEDEGRLYAESEATDGSTVPCSEDVAEYQDLLSCHSDGEISDIESTIPPSFGGESIVNANEPTGGGILSYIRSRALDSIKWIWQRPIQIIIRDLTFVLRFDLRRNIGFECHVDYLECVAELKPRVGPQQLSLISMVARNADLVAMTGETSPKVISLESVSVEATIAHGLPNTGLVCEKIFLSFNGTSTVRCDKASLMALIKCKVAQDIIQAPRTGGCSLPGAQKGGSMWGYAVCCSLERLHRQRRRYNFSLSHLRFFARVRERYLHLLDACHRHQSVEGYVQDLAEAEQDLLYEDVILFLRRHVQQRYSVVPQATQTLARSDESSRTNTILAYHFEWNTVRLCLSDMTSIVVTNVSCITRNSERVFQVGGALVETQGYCQASNWATFSSDASMPLLRVSQQVDTEHVTTAVQLADVSLSLQLGDLCVAAASVLDDLIEINPWKWAPSRDLPAMKNCSHTLIVAVSRFECWLDAMQLVVERFSFAKSESLTEMPHYGCTLRQLFIRSGDSYFVSPIDIGMKPSGKIVVPEVALHITRTTWEFLRMLCCRVGELLKKMPNPEVDSTIASASTAQEEKIDFAFLERCRVLTPRLHNLVGSLSLFIKGCHVIFEPLNLTLTVSSVLFGRTMHGKYKATHVDIKYVACTCDCVRLMSLNVTLKYGLHFYIPEDLQGANILKICSASFAYKYSEDMRVNTEEITLAQIEDAYFLFKKHIMYASLGVAHALNGGVVISSSKIISSTDLTSSASTTRPYRSSFIQLSFKLSRLVLPKIGAIPFAILGIILSKLLSFIKGEVLSVCAYRLILNAFADIAVDLNTHECVIECEWSKDRYGKLVLDTSLSAVCHECEKSDKKRGVALEAFGGPLLPVFTRTNVGPIVFKTDLSRLTFSLSVFCLSASLELIGGSAASTVKGVFCISSVEVQMPLCRFNFWDDDVRAAVPLPPKATAEYISVGLEQEEASPRIGVVTMKGAEVRRGSALTLPPLTCDMVKLDCSDTVEMTGLSSSEEEQELIDVQLESWDARLNLSRERTIYYDALELALFFVSAADSFHPHICISRCMADQEFNLDTTGDLHFSILEGALHLETRKVLVMERCCFMASRKERHLIICEDTTVVFRNCTFRHPHGDFVLLSDKTAIYALEQCSEIFGMPADTGCPQLSEMAGGSTVSPFKFRVTLKKGLFRVKLMRGVTFVVSQHQATVNSLSSKKMNSKQLRIENIRVEWVRSGCSQMMPVCIKIAIEAESSFSARREFTLTGSLSFGEVSIPIIPSAICPVFSLLRDLHTHHYWRELVKRGRFVAPALRRERMEEAPVLSYEGWRVIFSISLISLQVLLPNRVPIATLTVSNVFLCSIKDRHAEDGVMHARMGLHGVAVHEFSNQCFKPLLTNHLMVEAQGKLGGASGLCELQISVSQGNIDVSSEQVRLLKYLIECTHDLEMWCSAARIINEAGMPFSLRMPSGGALIVSDQQELTLQEFLKPDQLFDIRRDEDSLDHIEVAKSNAATYNLATPATFCTSASVLLFSSGFRLHVISAVDSHFNQCVWVRTLIQVKNETTYRLIFTSDSSSDSRVVGRGAVSCLPESLLGCKGLNIVLSFDDGDSCLSLKEPLWHRMTAMECAELAYAQESPPQSVAMEFISHKDASSHFVSLDFELIGNGGIMMFAHLSQPLIVNQTCFPIMVDFLHASSSPSSSPELVTSLKIEPGASASAGHLDPAVSCPSRVHIDVYTILYQSPEDLKLCSPPHDDSNASVSFTVRHCKYPRRYFFELTVSYEARPYPGRKTAAWVISASSQAFIRNECEVDVLILLTASGTPAGSLPADGLRSRSGGQNLGYVPFDHGLRLKVQELFFSEEFEIIPGFAGVCIQCESKGFNGTAPVGHAMFFLLRPIANGGGRFFDILPPLVIVNQHPALRLCGCHMVRRIDQTEGAGGTGLLLVSNFHVDASAHKQYFTMAKDGYSNYFSVSFDDHSPHFSFSKTDLLPNTSWRGYIEHNNSFHCIDIVRKGLYDPVKMVISGPQPALLRVVNMTGVSFREVDALMVKSMCSSHPGDRELVLTRASGSGASLRISLLGDHNSADDLEASAIEKDVWTRTVVGDRSWPTMVLLFNPRTPIFGHRDALTLPEEGRRFELRSEVSVFKQCLNLRDGACMPMQLQLESLSIYAAYANTLSVQCTATGLSIHNECDGEQISVLEPFELSLTMRDATWTLCSVNINSFQTNVSPIQITISDWLVYQVQQFFEHCRLATLEGSAFHTHDSGKVTLLLEQVGPLRYISADQVIFSMIPIEISWDRSVVPPTDYIFGDSALSLIIPSLHHARFVLPRLQFKNLFTPSLDQLATTIKQLFLTEILKQLPQIVGSVGFFKNDSSLIQRISSGLTSFFSWTSKQDEKTCNDAFLL